MKIRTLTILLFLVITSANVAFSQRNIGLHTDNYAGVYSLTYNPAEIINSPYKIDIKIASFNATADSDFFGLKRDAIFGDKSLFSLSKLLNSSTDQEYRDAFATSSEFSSIASSYSEKNLYLFGEISTFPSFILRFGKEHKQSLGFNFRTRYQMKSTGAMSDLLLLSFGLFNDISSPYKDASLQHSIWNEYAITYARAIVDNESNFFSTALTVKLNRGVASIYNTFYNKGIADNKDIAKIIPSTATELPKFAINTEVELGYSKFYNYGIERLSLDNIFNYGEFGFGADLGFVWEKRTAVDSISTGNMGLGIQKSKKYKYKIGLSLMDIGYTPYRTFSGNNNKYTINKEIPIRDFLVNITNSLDDKGKLIGLRRVYENSATDKELKENSFDVWLPSRANAYFDYAISSKLYANASVTYYPNFGDELNIKGLSEFTITPRFETKRFSAYMPISANLNNNFNLGLGFRAGPLVIGVKDILPILSIRENVRSANIYAGLSISLFDRLKRKTKRQLKEEEDTSEDVDLMTEEEEKIEEIKPNEEIDENDKSFHENKEFEDKRKQLAEQMATKDKSDNNKESTPNKSLFNKINFKRDRYTLDNPQVKNLDEAAQFLKNHRDKVLMVGVHTDGIGSENENLVLSKQRANFIKVMLIIKGISPSRVIVNGYGESRPIATNTTATGRAKNRRVEFSFRSKE